MHKLFFYFDILLTLILIACNTNDKTQVNSQVGNILSEIDTICNNNSITDSVYELSLTSPLSKKDKFLEANILLYKAIVEHMEEKSDKAFDSYWKALQTFEKCDKGLYDEQLIYKFNRILYHNIGRLYRNNQMYDESLDMFFKEHEIANKKQDNNDIMHANIEIANTYLFKKSYDSASIYCNRAMSFKEHVSDMKVVFKAYFVSGQINNNVDDYRKALSDFHKALEYANKTTYHKKEKLDECNISLATLYYNMSNDDSMYYFLDKLEPCHNPLILSYKYYLLYNTEKEHNDFDKALKYYQQYIKYTDTIHQQSQLIKISQITNKMDSEKEKYEITMEHKKQKLIIVVVSSLALLLCICIVLFLSIKYSKNKKVAKEIKEESYRNDKRIQELIGELEKVTIENNNKVDSEEMKKIGEDSLRNFIATNRISKNIKIISTVNDCDDRELDSISEADWENYVIATNILNDDFIDSLKEKYPLLTKWDIIICSLVKNKVQSKVIAKLIGIEVKSYQKKLSRITRQKMQVEDNRTLTDIINGITNNL